MSNTTEAAGLDVSLDEAQRATLNAVLDLIIAPSEDGRMPGAAAYDVWGYIGEAASDLLPAIRDELARLDTHARGQHGQPFAALAAPDREAVLAALRAAEASFMFGLATQTIRCYYQQDRVLEAIGMQARPPYPQGYEVKSGDLSLLEPVRRRGKVYRDASDA